jgi:hypothetical protein
MQFNIAIFKGQGVYPAGPDPPEKDIRSKGPGRESPNKKGIPAGRNPFVDGKSGFFKAPN